MRYLIAFLLFIPTVALSQKAETYECKTKHFADGGFIGEVYLLSIAGDQVGIYDALIHHVHKGPITARMSGKTAKRYTFKWVVKDIKLQNGVGVVKFTGRFNRQRRELNVSGNLIGADNTIYATATCVRKS